MSRFVSGGTVDQPAERDDAWAKAQQEIEDKHRQKEEASRQEGGKSLFETLQANKAAKQEAFEESIRLKNQFRSLDEDEIEFLDSVLASTRAQEAAVKKETTEQLDLFKRQQDEREKLERINETPSKPAESEAWTVSGRKRRRGKEKDVLPGVKVRKSSSVTETADIAASKAQNSPPETVQSELDKSRQQTFSHEIVKEPPKLLDRGSMLGQPSPSLPSPPAASLGLGGYSSDED